MNNLTWALLWLTLLPIYSFAQVNVRGDTTVCAGEYKIQLFADPPGGIWAGDSVTPDGRFNPDTLFLTTPGAPNPVVLSYTVSGITVQKRITIRPTPRVRILTNDTNLCANSPAFRIRVLPAGGTFSGNGVGIDGQFTPTRLLLGLNTITYTYVDPNNRLCPNDDEVRILINNFNDVTAGSNRTLCSKDDPILLTGGTPSGGTYSGPGVVGGVFTPTEQLIGVNSITYTFTNPDQCVNSNTLVVTVNRTPTAFAGNDLAVCENSPAFNLQGFTPANGTFNGPGVLPNGRFTPSIATVGFKLLTYEIIDQGCPDKDTIIIETIQAPRNVEAGRDTTVCANAAGFNLTRGTPAGGRYFGAGVDSLTGRFTTSDTLVGSQKIYYQVRNPRGCRARDSLTINVRPLPRANAGIDFNACSGNVPVQIGDVRIPNTPGFAYSYLWTGSDGTFGFDSIRKSNPTVRFTNTNPNPVVRSYYVRVTRNETGPPQISCFAQDTVVVTIYPKPISRTIPPLTAKACPGDSIILRAERRPDYVYQWLNGPFVLTAPSDTNFFYVARSSGRYRLISAYDIPVRGGVCADTSSGDSIFFKPVITPVITGFANFCRGLTDTLRVFPRNRQFTYQWLKDQTQILIGERDTTYNASTPGFYQVVISDTRDGLTCSFISAPTRVDSIRTPFVDLVNRSSDSTFTVCSAQIPLTLVAPEDTNFRGAFQYEWQDQTTSRFYTVDTSGVYYVSVFNRCGRVTDTLRITAINSSPVFSIVPTADKTIRVCRGIPYVIQGPAGNTVRYRIEQRFGDSLVLNSTNIDYGLNTDSVGTYQIAVLVTSPRGCTFFDSATINVVECEPTVYIPTAFTPQNDGLNDLWELQAYSVDDIQLSVFNRWGEMVYYAGSIEEVQDRPWNGKFKDQDCLSGAYQYVVNFKGRQPGTEEVINFKRTGTVTIIR